MATAQQESKTWIPIDVKIHWFSFLSAKDLANASRVCRSWVSLTQKAADAMITQTIAAPAPQLSRGAKLKFLHRLQNATDKENMGYLLSWAAGCREYTPFLHKLLLLRDVIREDWGLPGGLHEMARPEAYAETEEDIRALFTYRTGPAPGAPPPAPGMPPPPPGQDLVPLPPLLVAASRGNVDALQLLLLFGEGVHGRRKSNERALYAAAEQGNLLCVAVLLGRVPLRPPVYPAHIARRLGLIRPVWNVYGHRYTYASGAAQGPQNVPAAIAGARMRAELAAATGMATATGPRASAAAAAALTGTGQGTIPGAIAAAHSTALVLSGGSGGGGKHGSASGSASASALSMSNASVIISPVEAAVAQMEAFESDGRYRTWCHGYHMGTFWALYDTALANWEARHGLIGAEVELPAAAAARMGMTAAVPAARAGGAGAGAGAVPSRFLTRQTSNNAMAAAPRVEIRTNLYNLAQRLEQRLTPGSSFEGLPKGVMPAYAAQALLLSRLPPNLPLAAAARMRPPHFIHPRIPAVIDYGSIAADALQVKVRLNAGPVEGRTPLVVAAEKGRTEIAYLLLSHHDPAGAVTGEVPELPPRLDDDGPPAAAAAAGPAGPGAPAAPAAAAPGGNTGGAAAAAAAGGAGLPVAPPPPTVPAATLAARAALAAIAQSTASALAVPVESLTTRSTGRAEDAYADLLGERRDRVDVDLTMPGAHTALCLACERGDERLVSLLLHWGADVNRQGKKEATPLLVASMAGHEHIIRLLLRTSCNRPAAEAVAATIKLIQERREVLAAAMGKAPPQPQPLSPSRAANAPAAASGSGSTGTIVIRDARDEENLPGFGKLLIGNVGSGRAAGGRITVAGGNGKGSALQRLGLAPFTVESALGQGGSSKGTAAANAMGSTIASQTGRKKAKEDSRKQEDPSIDQSEPSVVVALAVAAAGTGGTDDWGHPIPPRPAPYDINTIYLPVEEAEMSNVNAYAARRGLSKGFLDRGVGSSGTASAAWHADMEPEEVLKLSTADSYTQLVASGEHLRTKLKATVFSILSKSRIVNGVGAMEGRPVLDLNLGDESAYTPLFIMASAGKVDSVMLLASAGADVTLTTKRGKTPIYGAVEKCHVEVVEYLLPRYSASQLRANTTYGTNVVHAAGKAGNSRIRDMLNGYCVDYDMREAKVLKAEAAARRVDPQVEVANQMKMLRKMAEAAKKKEAELEARRARRGGSISDGEDEDGSDSDSGGGGGGGGRGRSRSRARKDDDSPYKAGPRGKSQTARGKSTERGKSKGGDRAKSKEKGGNKQAKAKAKRSGDDEDAEDGRGSGRGTGLESALTGDSDAGSGVDSGRVTPIVAVTRREQPAPGSGSKGLLLSRLLSDAPPTEGIASPTASKAGAGGATATRTPSGAAAGGKSSPLQYRPVADAVDSRTSTGSGSGSGSGSGAITLAGAPSTSPLAAAIAKGSGGGDGLSVFERLAARAREMEAKKKIAEEEAAKKPSPASPLAAALQGLPPRGRPAAKAGEGGKAASKAASTAGTRPASGASNSTADSASATAGAGGGKRTLSAVRAPAGKAPAASTKASASASAGATARPRADSDADSAVSTDGALQASFTSTGSGKYGGMSGAELRASARAALTTDGADAPAANAAASSSSAAATGASASAGDARAKRAAYYERIFQRSDSAGATSDSGPAAALAAARRDSDASNLSADFGAAAQQAGSGFDRSASPIRGEPSDASIDAGLARLRRMREAAASSNTPATAAAAAAASAASAWTTGSSAAAASSASLSSSASGALGSPSVRNAQLDRMLAQLDAVEKEVWASVTHDKGDEQAAQHAQHAQQRGGKGANKQPPHTATGSTRADATPARTPPSPLVRGKDGGRSPGTRSEPGVGTSSAAADYEAAELAPPLRPRHGFGEAQALSASSPLGFDLDEPGSPISLTGAHHKASKSSKAKAALLGAALGVKPSPGSAGKGRRSGGAYALDDEDGPARSKLSREEIAARDERNKAREAARLARLEQKRLEDEARAAAEAAAAAHAAPATNNSLALAAAAYGGMLKGAAKKKPKAFY